MLNLITLVGRLTSDPQINEVEGKKVSTITLAVPRSFKNAEGEYENDFIDIVLWSAIAENTTEYCRKGDLVGIKGRVQTTINENEDGTKNYKLEVIAEKVTFLSSKKSNEEEK